MIEFPITLTSGGSVCLPGHAFALAQAYYDALDAEDSAIDAPDGATQEE